ncbi:MAG TPA: primosomal protein N' [Rhodanobacteraceae bacterium]|nr:primosomal protein N' [Rhodanobacteraceae bacterium]
MISIVRVAVPLPLAQLFDYRISEGSPPAPGCRVLVAFGQRKLVGMVVECTRSTERPPAGLKSVLRVLDPEPLATAEWWTTLRWAARYYQHPLGEVLETALPTALRSARALPGTGAAAIALTPAGQGARSDPRRRRGTRIDVLLERLSAGAATTSDLDSCLPGWRNAARTLRARGWIESRRLVSARPEMPAVTGPALNPDQRAAVTAVAAAPTGFAPFLLEGVTGSGKTEVYLTLIAECLARGRQALVLVPEIALTPQILGRFRARLGVEITVLHSGLGDAERARAWLAAARGEARVILGTRSAVFVPLPCPGLLVIDEEHDTSYKQQEGFRYHARDLAVMRAKALAVPILLGSATPSLESLANVAAARYGHLRLSERAGAARPPALKVVDLRRQRLLHGLAEPALAELDRCLARDETALVFKNRRGYAPVLLCHDCGWSAQCAQCERPLTWHRGAARLRCHHCGAEQRLPDACPDCGGLALNPQGLGTERLEDVLKLRYPAIPVLRVDRDTMSTRVAREALLDQLVDTGPRILVGTQMLAKGHDLPQLTLVIVVGVDEGLYSVDFRAAERLGQLIVQVAGRAGRAAKPGTVMLQTHHPDHPLLAQLLGGGYRALAASLLGERRAANLPPWSHFALLRAEARREAALDGFLAAAAAAAAGDAAVSARGPMPAPMPKRAGLHRAQLLIEADERGALQAFLPGWLDALRALPAARRVRWSIDVDPVDLY